MSDDYTIVQMKTRAEWFLSEPGGLVRKNFLGFDHDLPVPGVRVAVYGYYNERYDPIAEIAEANWFEYCYKHGYALRTYPGAYTDTSDGDRMHDPVRGEARFKLYYDIRGLFDIVMFLDIDSLLVNMDRRIEDVVPGAPLVWTYDDNGPNTSLIIARTDDRTESHLRYAYEYALNNNNVRHDRIERGGISDQDAMTALMNIPPFRDTFGHCYAASEVGVAFKEADVTPQTWIRSYAGMSLEEKIAAMKERVG